MQGEADRRAKKKRLQVCLSSSFFLEREHFLFVLPLPSKISLFLFITPPTQATPTKTINPCVLKSLLSYLSFKILQLSILLLWQRLLIIRSEIRLARAPCPASISHARGTLLARMARRAGLSVFMLLVKIYRQPLRVWNLLYWTQTSSSASRFTGKEASLFFGSWLPPTVAESSSLP